MFRLKQSIPVDYNLQGYIYFNSKLYATLGKEMQQQILTFCTKAGGEHYQALFEFVTTDEGATSVCQKHFLSQSTLERIVRRYYIIFAESI